MWPQAHPSVLMSSVRRETRDLYLQTADCDCDSEATTESGPAGQTLDAAWLEDDTRSCTPDNPGMEHRGFLASIGSALHGTGECRPCAWFWKQAGCLNEDQCRHCHLCDKNEIKARRARTRKIIRSTNAVTSSALPTLLTVQDRAAPRHTTLAPSKLPGPMAYFQEEPALAEVKKSCLPSIAAAIPAGAAGVPSVGSHLHATGMCKPCAWYWKPQGCNNGADCLHCHLCPPGEHAARRKAKNIVLAF